MEYDTLLSTHDIIKQLNLNRMKIGDKVKRSEIKPTEEYAAWCHLSIDTEYEIEHILPNGLIVLKDFLILVNKREIVVL